MKARLYDRRNVLCPACGEIMRPFWSIVSCTNYRCTQEDVKFIYPEEYVELIPVGDGNQEAAVALNTSSDALKEAQARIQQLEAEKESFADWDVSNQKDKEEITPAYPVPLTAAELITAIETLFACCEGPPRAYFEIPLGTIDPETKEYVSNMPLVTKDVYVARCVYVKLGVGMRHNDENMKITIQLIISVFWATFQRIHTTYFHSEDMPLLFWRRTPTLDSYDGGTGLTCRLFIPGVPQGGYGDSTWDEGETIPKVTP
jgi:hypothetical protein